VPSEHRSRRTGPHVTPSCNTSLILPWHASDERGHTRVSHLVVLHHAQLLSRRADQQQIDQQRWMGYFDGSASGLLAQRQRSK
jgi:hypothetical protein